jgi:hypothetical protein
MRLFRRKSTWDKVKDPIAARALGKGTVRSSLVAVAAAAGVTALSSAVSSFREKKQS